MIIKDVLNNSKNGSPITYSIPLNAIDLNNITGRTDVIATFSAIDPTNTFLYISAKIASNTTSTMLFIFELQTFTLLYFIGDPIISATNTSPDILRLGGYNYSPSGTTSKFINIKNIIPLYNNIPNYIDTVPNSTITSSSYKYYRINNTATNNINGNNVKPLAFILDNDKLLAIVVKDNNDLNMANIKLKVATVGGIDYQIYVVDVTNYFIVHNILSFTLQNISFTPQGKYLFIGTQPFLATTNIYLLKSDSIIDGIRKSDPISWIDQGNNSYVTFSVTLNTVYMNYIPFWDNNTNKLLFDNILINMKTISFNYNLVYNFNNLSIIYNSFFPYNTRVRTPFRFGNAFTSLIKIPSIDSNNYSSIITKSSDNYYEKTFLYTGFNISDSSNYINRGVDYNLTNISGAFNTSLYNIYKIENIPLITIGYTDSETYDIKFPNINNGNIINQQIDPSLVQNSIIHKQIIGATTINSKSYIDDISISTITSIAVDDNECIYYTNNNQYLKLLVPLKLQQNRYILTTFFDETNQQDFYLRVYQLDIYNNLSIKYQDSLTFGAPNYSIQTSNTNNLTTGQFNINYQYFIVSTINGSKIIIGNNSKQPRRITYDLNFSSNNLSFLNECNYFDSLVVGGGGKGGDAWGNQWCGGGGGGGAGCINGIPPLLLYNNNSISSDSTLNNFLKYLPITSNSPKITKAKSNISKISIDTGCRTFDESYDSYSDYITDCKRGNFSELRIYYNDNPNTLSSINRVLSFGGSYGGNGEIHDIDLVGGRGGGGGANGVFSNYKNGVAYVSNNTLINLNEFSYGVNGSNGAAGGTGVTTNQFQEISYSASNINVSQRDFSLQALNGYNAQNNSGNRYIGGVNGGYGGGGGGGGGGDTTGLNGNDGGWGGYGGYGAGGGGGGGGGWGNSNNGRGGVGGAGGGGSNGGARGDNGGGNYEGGGGGGGGCVGNCFTVGGLKTGGDGGGGNQGGNGNLGKYGGGGGGAGGGGDIKRIGGYGGAGYVIMYFYN